MKRVTALAWFFLTGLLPGALRADALPPSTPNQTQISEQQNDLSWPKDKLLSPLYKWQKHAGIAEKCLLINRLDPKEAASLKFLQRVDLPGEWFVTVISSSNVFSSTIWDFNGILREAGYSQQVPISEKQVFLGGDRGNEKGYIKREGKTIRLILVSFEFEVESLLHCNPGFGMNDQPPCIPSKVEVFVSDITPLEQILKEPKRSHTPKT